MAKLTPEEFAEKHARRLKGAVEDIRTGVEKTTVAPSEKAVEKQDKLKAKLIESIDKGIWASRLKKVSLEDWKRKMIDKGLSRISGGIDSAREKVVDFANQLLPYIDSVKSKVDKMPDLTLEDSINKMTTFIREMAKFKKK